jgi:hypothetical protein
MPAGRVRNGGPNVRITGIVLAIVGLVIALFCGITFMNYKAPTESDAVMNTEQRRGPELAIPLIIAGAAVGVGTAMYLYGGRGYVVSGENRNGPSGEPAV